MREALDELDPETRFVEMPLLTSRGNEAGSGEPLMMLKAASAMRWSGLERVGIILTTR